MHHIRAATLALAGTCLVVAPSLADAQAFRRGPGTAGFASNTLPRNDDGSTGLVDIGFGVNFFGDSFTRLFVNNNGNVTFNNPLGVYTPSAITGATSNPIIAAFFADVDTRGNASAVTTYGTGTIDGRNAFGVNYDGVGYYSNQTDKLNIFQLLLIDRHDVAAGDFDIEFNYDRILWETGSASGGVNGFGGTPALVGYASGAGTPGSFFQLPGSLQTRELIDGGDHALVSNRLNSDVDGRYVFNVRGGRVQPPPSVVPEPGTILLTATGLFGLAGVAARRRHNRN